MPDQEPAAAAEQEAAHPPERFLSVSRSLGRELGQPVTRGTIRGALALAAQSRAGVPEKMTRTEMLALLRRYLRSDA